MTKVVVPSDQGPNALNLGELFALYDEHFPEGAKARTIVAMERFHRSHLLRALGPDAVVESIGLADGVR